VNTYIGKEELYRTLRLAAPDLAAGEGWPTGYCHFPCYGKEFFEQLCAEQLITHVSAGRTTTRWEKRRDRNEALDCRIYARAAAATLRMDTWKEPRWAELEAALRVTRTTTGPVKTPMPKFRPMGATPESFMD
jgi:phage terminase large subunit GpA-like protein